MEILKKLSKVQKLILSIILVFVLIIIIILQNGPKEIANITVYDTKDLYIEALDSSDIEFEAMLYDNPNLYYFADFPIKLRVDSATATEEEAIELGEKLHQQVKDAVKEKFPHKNYRVNTYIYHSGLTPTDPLNPKTAKELKVIEN